MKREPTDPQVYHQVIGVLRHDLSDEQRAGNLIDVLLQKWPAISESWDLAGLFDKDGGRLDRALERFQKAIELEPNNGQARVHLAELYLVKGDMDRAERAMHEAIDRSPQEWTVWQASALLHDRRNDYEQAAKEYARAWELHPDDMAPPRTASAGLVSTGAVSRALKALTGAVEGSRGPLLGSITRTRSPPAATPPFGRACSGSLTAWSRKTRDQRHPGLAGACSSPNAANPSGHARI